MKTFGSNITSIRCVQNSMNLLRILTAIQINWLHTWNSVNKNTDSGGSASIPFLIML